MFHIFFSSVEILLVEKEKNSLVDVSFDFIYRCYASLFSTLIINIL